MNLSARDKKIAIVLAPLVLILGYWFLLLAPKREEAATSQTKLAEAEKARDTAQDQLRLSQGSKTSFASDYSTMLRLGKAIPENVDMPSLLVQLDAAARGTDIEFMKVAVSEAAADAAAPAPATGQPPAAAGGEPAQSTPGQQAESAANTTESANAASASAEQSGVDPADTQTSTTAGGAPTPAAGSAAGTPALTTVALDLEFEGSFFDLADFFHRLKRFVQVENQDVLVNGRLVTIEGVSFTSGEEFPSITATLTATAYLAPEAQGTTAGATPAGPATVPAATPEPAPAPATPTATATP